jgi:hypothetical protein
VLTTVTKKLTLAFICAIALSQSSASFAQQATEIHLT